MLAAIDTRSAIGFRDWTIILMFLDTGLRVTELINLEMEKKSGYLFILKIIRKYG